MSQIELSDCWNGYKACDLQIVGYDIHFAVNNSYFVDPNAGCPTQCVEHL